VIDARQLLVLVIRPALQHIEFHSKAAEQLVLGTALVESEGRYLQQLGGGPALGLWQMEPSTHEDIVDNYLAFRPELARKMDELRTTATITDGASELVGNLYYGAAMCRLQYRRAPGVLPYAGDVQRMAEYWKAYYNTVLGAGTIEKAIPHFELAVRASQ
jgi:hypothetical protein